MTISENIVLTAKNQASAAMRQLQRDSSSTADSIKGAFQKIGVGLSAAAIFGGVIQGMKMATSEAINADKAQAQLAAVLKSTGGAAGLSAAEMTKLASKYSILSGVEDDTILQGEAVLATFTAVGRDVFPRATLAALNTIRGVLL